MIGGIDLQNRTLDYSARKANTQKNSILEKESFNDILKCTLNNSVGSSYGKQEKSSVQGLEVLGPSVPDEVKEAWQKAEKETGINAVAKALDGKLTQITEVFAMSIVDRYNGGTGNILGNTVESAKAVLYKALENLGIPKNIEEKKEKAFYEAFLRYLGY